ncbi:YbaN family protein [Pusillimonas noertemannii]|uniref:YbaN family protein n=1 Tax=Pusillimonas noertemannii TaxID=305977 RepID=UPI0002F4EF59|nr:YbaN family protein [Pusillimonas noertemannii]
MKIFFNVVGSIALALAIIGAAIPLVPTTPFLLLAAACFMRGSERMYRWLTGNRVFGRYLLDFQERKGVTLRVKLTAIAVMWVSLSYSIYMLPSLALRIPLALMGIGVTAYLALGLKTLQRPGPSGSRQINDQTPR